MRLEVVGAVVTAVVAEQFFIQNSAKADAGNTADKRAANGTKHGTRCRSCWTGNAEHRSANASALHRPFGRASGATQGASNSAHSATDALAVMTALHAMGMTDRTGWDHENHLMQSRLSRPAGYAHVGERGFNFFSIEAVAGRLA